MGFFQAHPKLFYVSVKPSPGPFTPDNYNLDTNYNPLGALPTQNCSTGIHSIWRWLHPAIRRDGCTHQKQDQMHR